MVRRRLSVLGVFAAVAAIVGGTLATAPANADVLFVSDVSASISAPASTSGGFTVSGTLTNTGTLDQPAGSTLAFSVTNATVTSAPGCSIGDGGAVCTTGALVPGQTATYAVSVTPDVGASSVVSQVVATAAQFETNVLDSTNNTASAATSVLYGVDASMTNAPSDVRYGSDVLLSLTVTNTQAPQTVNAVLASGGVVDTRIALPSECATTNAGQDLSCSFAGMAPGASKSFDVAVTVPTTGSTMLSTLEVAGASGGSKSVSTTTNLYSDAQAFVPEGDKLTYQGSNQFTSFNVPIGSTEGGGTFLKLQEVNLVGTMCGTQPCIRQAAEALFPSTGKYAGHDVDHPYLWDIKYDERRVCNGNSANCQLNVYWIPSNAPLTQAQRIPNCPTFSNTAPTSGAKLNNIDEPCLQKVAKGTAGYSTYTVAVLRDIVIPIIGTGKSG